MRNGVGVDARGKTSLSAVHWRISYFWVRWTLCYPVFLASARGMNICFGPFLFAAKALVCGIVPFVKLLCKHPMVFACGYTIGFTCCGFWIYLSLFQFFSISSISRTDWREDRDRFFVLHQSAFLTPLVVSTLLRFGFRLFEKRKRGHSAGWERSYSLPFHRISNLFKTLGSSSVTGPGSADFYSRTKPSWLFIFFTGNDLRLSMWFVFFSRPRPAGDEWDL